MYTGENPPLRGKESRNRNVMRLSKPSSELVNVFKEARRNFILFFHCNQAGRKFKNLVANVPESTVPYLFGLKNFNKNGSGENPGSVSQRIRIGSSLSSKSSSMKPLISTVM
jgi:hypothetical protein